MISVQEALAHVLDLVTPLGTEDVPLRHARGRVLSETVISRRTQPPFSASAMDGYAVKSQEVERDALFKVIGEAAAGHAWSGTVGPGQAVRIFTGAPLPNGADHVVIQENVERRGDLLTILDADPVNAHVRPAGGDFVEGTTFEAPRRLSPADVALLASMNIPDLPVTRRPVVALISTGDELVAPGETPRDDQIVVSNTYGVAAMLEEAGATTRILPIARDTVTSLTQAFELAQGSDLVVTIGGASVGDHDLVANVAADLNMDRSFYKIAMRPGKPLMAGRMGRTPMVGLPGNPVSAMVCARIFLVPAVHKMLGLAVQQTDLHVATLAHPIAPNGPREHYMRATVEDDKITVFENQDSSLLHILCAANALLVRPPKDPARVAGEDVMFLRL